MNKIKTAVGIITAITAIGAVTQAFAGTPITSQTQQKVVIYDRAGYLTTYSRLVAGTTDGLRTINEREMSGDEVRSTRSHFSCDIPYNRYKDIDQDLFPKRNDALAWYRYCFDRNTYVEVTRDLMHAIEAVDAVVGEYQLVDHVRVRNMSAPDNEETREIVVVYELDRNKAGGVGRRWGARMEPSSYHTNLYVVYENSGSVDLLDGLVSRPYGGSLRAYTMDGATPEDSNHMELIDIYENPEIMDTYRLTEQNEYFDFHPGGVKNVLEYAGHLMEEFNSEIMIVDYGNPISIKECPIAGNGECLGPLANPSDPDYKMMLDIYTTDRTYYRNVCTKEPVVYEQDNRMVATTDYIRERYIITDRDDIRGPLTDQELLALNRFSGIETNDFANSTVENNFTAIHSGYDYDTDIDYFETRITEFVGKHSSVPNNIIQPNNYCVFSNPSTMEELVCYEPFNGIFLGHYRTPLPEVRDVSIVDVRYEERVMVEPGRTEEGPIHGERIEIPPVYEWETKSSCDIGGTRIYNVDSFCDNPNINCTSVITK